jgi:DNA invertase Pin-like site-specific DNA recombinase
MGRPDSIRAVGLRVHLDSTADRHKKKDYVDFLEMLENRASNNYIARAFGVTKNTVSKWLLIYYEEQARKQGKSISAKTAQ